MGLVMDGKESFGAGDVRTTWPLCARIAYHTLQADDMRVVVPDPYREFDGVGNVLSWHLSTLITASPLPRIQISGRHKNTE